MKDALDVVMAWQLRNPDVKDPSEAIAAAKASMNSELPSRLAAHFLQLTVRPLFSQTSSNPDVSSAGYKAPSRPRKAKLPDDTSAAPWKERTNSWAIELLRWSISILDAKGIEANWALLIPPILKILDDIDLQWKAVGAELLTLLLKSTPPSLLARTGVGKVFEDTLIPLFTYLPTLTPENESVVLLDKAFPALMALPDVLYPPSPTPNTVSSLPSPSTKPTPDSSLSTPREKFLDKLLRDGILSPLFHAPPSAYPKLATTLLSHLPPLLRAMGIDSVKHLQPLTTLLSNILAEPLGLAYPPLMVAATKVLQSVVLNAWPRVKVYRGEILRGVTLAWLRCCDEEGKEGVVEVWKELREVVGMMNAVFAADDEVKDAWGREKEELVGADSRLEGLFAVAEEYS
jgi:hypothetical protein